MKIRDAFYSLLRVHDIKTIFGNPGSNELPFLSNFPSDFKYILRLQEGGVIAMADGYSMAKNMPSLVNIHAAAGTGNAMGNLTNAQASKSPIIITSGQQARRYISLNALLTNVDSTTLVKPLVKWSSEPSRPKDVPHALSSAIFNSTTEPSGPVYLSIPLDDWEHEVDINSLQLLKNRTLCGNPVVDNDVIVNLSKKLSAAKNPVMILGPQVDNYLGWQGAISLSEKLCLPVFIAPSPSRCPFPTKHHNYLGILPSGIQDVAEKLSEYDFIISFGTAIFRYHEYQEGDYLYSNSELWAITSDPDEGSRSPVGNVIIGETSDALFRISEIVEPTKDYVCINPPTEDANSDYLDLARYSSEGFSKEDILDAISYAKKNDTIIVNEWTSSDNCWDRLDISQPGSLFFPAAGGLGWGLPAAIGFQIGCADRRVIAILGDGAFQYSISALWTAAKYNIPVVFIVANNSCYGALHKFSTLMDKSGIPGLDIPNIDILNIASGYGINSKRVNSLYDFVTTIKSALEANKPFLIEITQKDW